MDTHPTEPAVSTDAAAEPAEPAEPAIESLPDLSNDFSFENSLEQAFAAFNEPQSAAEPADTNTDQPTGNDEPAEPVAADEPDGEKKGSESGSDAENPIESLDADVGDDWTPKAAAAFQRLKADRKAERAELERLRAGEADYRRRIEELEGLTKDKDVDSLRARLEEMDKQIRQYDVQKSQAYIDSVEKPMDALVKRADEIGMKHDVKLDTLVELLSLDDSAEQDRQIAELFPEATDREKASLYRIIEDMRPIAERQEQIFANAEQFMAEAKEAEAAAAEAEAANRAKVRENVSRNVVERIRQRLPFLSSIDDLNMEAIQKRAAEVDPITAHPVDNAFNAVSGSLLPVVVKQYAQAQREIDTLTERLAAYENAEPTGGEAGNGSSAVTANMSFEDRVSAALG